MRRLIAILFNTISRWGKKFASHFAPTTEYYGIRVVDVTAGDEANGSVTHLEEALELLKSTDELRFGWVSKYLANIMIVRLKTAEYDYNTGLCLIDANIAKNREPEFIAMVLVHEATHARIHSFGIAATKDTIRNIERICVNQEMRFAAKLPDSARWLQSARTRLQRSQQWTSRDAHARRLEELRAVDMPRWYVWLYDFAFRPDEDV